MVAGRFQTGSSKAFNAMLDVEKKVLSGRSVGDDTDLGQKTVKHFHAPITKPSTKRGHTQMNCVLPND